MHVVLKFLLAAENLVTLFSPLYIYFSRSHALSEKVACGKVTDLKPFYFYWRDDLRRLYDMSFQRSHENTVFGFGSFEAKLKGVLVSFWYNFVYYTFVSGCAKIYMFFLCFSLPTSENET